MQLPSTAVLKAALLTAGDLGPAFSRMAVTGGSGPAGCPQLDKVNASDPTKNSVEVEFEGHKAGPFLGEALAAGTPAVLDPFFAKTKTAMASCHAFTFGTGSDAMTLAASPISFGGADTAALRLDGTTSGVQVTGFMTFDDLHDAILGYFYIELFDGSSQNAFAFHSQALAKAQRVLGGVPGDQ